MTRALIAAGDAGLITGHTNRPELTGLGTGFYANPGASGDLVVGRQARFGLPTVFVSERHLGFVEGPPWSPRFYAESRTIEFLARHTHPPEPPP